MRWVHHDFISIFTVQTSNGLQTLATTHRWFTVSGLVHNGRVTQCVPQSAREHALVDWATVPTELCGDASTANPTVPVPTNIVHLNVDPHCGAKNHRSDPLNSKCLVLLTMNA